MDWLQASIEPLSDDLASVPFDGHLVLIKERDEIIVLNETARLIWDEIARGAAKTEAARRVAERFGVAPDHALADVEAALVAWRTRGLIGRCAPARTAAAQSLNGRTAPPPRHAVDCTYAWRGRPVGFRFQDPDVERLIRPLLSPWETAAPTACEVIDLYRDGADHAIAANGVEIGRDRLAEEVLGLAVGQVLEISYPDAHWLAVFHAGAVADEHHAIVMPAASGSGKSTLTAALVHSGLRYLSDDIVPLDGRMLHVLPVPLASSLKQGSWPILTSRFPQLDGLPTHRDNGRPRRYLDLSADARNVPEGGVPVRALVFPQYQPQGATQIEMLRPGHALERLLQARCWISLDHDDLGETLRWVLETPSYRLNYSTLEQAIAIVHGLFVD